MENYICGFIDILGAKEKMMNESEDFAINVDNWFASLPKLRSEHLDIRSSSDSIIFSLKIKYDYASLLDISLIVIYLVQRAYFDIGCLLRGGISYGKLYVGKSSILGPALIRAYEIETKEAIYPRVVIDDSIEMLFRNSTDQNVHDAFSSVFQKDFDNRLYVRYSLSNLLNFRGNPQHNFSNIEAIFHRMLIKAKNQSVIQKYAWWANVMNRELEKEGKPERFVI